MDDSRSPLANSFRCQNEKGQSCGTGLLVELVTILDDYLAIGLTLVFFDDHFLPWFVPFLDDRRATPS